MRNKLLNCGPQNPMDPLILSFADGTTFFLGMGIVGVSEILLLRSRRPILRSLLIVLIVFGALLVATSGTPLPLWAYLLWAIAVFSGTVLLNQHLFSKPLHVGCLSTIWVTSVGLIAAELPHHRTPSFPVPEGATVYVVGDSISAGMGTREIPWPEVLDERTSHRIINLARAGATAESALSQARRIPEAGSYVILEIGGNDLLGDTPLPAFRHALDRLLSELRQQDHRILMFELPSVPLRNAYGKAQREIAAKHDIPMLPKRYFTAVLGTENGTLDGLHLSQIGHDTMAATVAIILASE